MTLADFIAQHNVTAKAERRTHNPNMPHAAPGMHHWCVFLRRRTTEPEGLLGLPVSVSMPVPFSQKFERVEEPTIEEVLGRLASNARTIENCPTFEQWCSELGMDNDSRRAERTYETCKRQAALLKEFLGKQAYEDLLFDTERQ